MAEGAVFGHRRMLPDIGAAFLGVALVTRIVQSLADQLSIDRSAMWAMTATAIHLSFEERVRKGFQRFTALQLVTIEADFRLGRRLQHAIPRCVADMAIGTGDVFVVV